MIKSIHVENFKTLRDVTIPLAPRITVMVGANNSGKSNALAALKLLGEMARRRSFFDAVRSLGGLNALQSRPTGETPRPPMLSATIGAGPNVLFMPPGVAHPPSYPVVRDLGELALIFEGVFSANYLTQYTNDLLTSLSGISVFDFSVAALRAPSLVQRGATLNPDGQNAAATLDAMAGEQPSLRDQIEEEVKAAAPDLKRLLTPPGAAPGTKILGIEEKNGAFFGADEMSDGLLLLIGLSLAAQTTASKGGLVAIEEPERGIHPRRIREVHDQLLKVAERGTQVVLTTHSPLLLDEFKDYPESVLIFDRDENGTHVTRLSDKPEWVEGLNEGPLGDIWYSGILGGVPKK